MRKLFYKQVKQIFKNGGCELLSEEYKNASTKLKYRCSCGNISEILLHSFKKGHRCIICSSKRIADKLSYDFEYVKYFFEKEGCILLSNGYKNSDSKLEFICNCGNKAVNTFQKFKKGRRCKKCGEEKRNSKLRHSYEYVKDYFDRKGCKLLSKEYKNDATLLDYICCCGNKSKITFNSLHNGSKCNKCGVQRTMGEKSVHWKSYLTDEDRMERRLIPGYKKWIKDIYKKDEWTCQFCSCRGDKLNAHHIENYADNKDKRMDVGNGITFCKKCHVEFHTIYGKRRNNIIQLHQFLKKAV